MRSRSSSSSIGQKYEAPLIGVMCRKCGMRLKAMKDVVNRLYLVRCDGCGTVVQSRARSLTKAVLAVGVKWWEAKSHYESE